MRIFLLGISLAWIAGLASAEVTVRGEAGTWSFAVDGEPFYVRGVTWGGGAFDEERWRADFKAIRELNANAIRTWGAAETQQLLDMAQEHGIKVMLGLWLRHGQPVAEDDDSFDWVNDAAGRKVQWNDTLRTVAAFKDHPALLCWGLGNEVILNIATEEEKVAYAKFMGELAAEIKKQGPSHPVASVSAWSIGWPYWKEHAPALDIYGINTYGYGAGAIPGEQQRLGIDRPYLICEFGATGEWETKDNRHGVKLDPSDEQKFSIIASGWDDMIAKHAGNNLGCFVFHLGRKLDSTGLWLSLRTDDLWRPAYHGTMKAFTGKLPADQLPVIETFDLEVEQGIVGSWVPARLLATDPEGKEINIRFAFNERRGERHHRDAVLPLESRSTAPGRWELRLPVVVEEGGIKVYALVDDGVNLSMAKTSLWVEWGP